VAVRLTAPHPKHGKVGTVVSDDDPQIERELIRAGYAVEAYKRSTPAKAAKAAPRKRAPRSKPKQDDDTANEPADGESAD
jgi:hypothetical protein